jgi:hypothetical protein
MVHSLTHYQMSNVGHVAYISPRGMWLYIQSPIQFLSNFGQGPVNIILLYSES